MSHKTNENSEDVLLYVDLGNGLGKWIPLENISYVTEYDDVNKDYKSYHKINLPKLYPWEIEQIKLF
jgi:hypothetical protein